MRRLVLHAGMDKTGTTAAQVHFSRRRDQHLDRGILYPLAGRFPNDVNHFAFFAAATDFPDAIPTPLSRNQTRKPCSAHLKELRQEIASTGAHTVILSHEVLWQPLAFPPDIISRIVKGILQDWPGARAEILVFLRESGAYALSSYAQSVTGPQRSTQSFSRHVKQLSQRRTLSFERRLTEFAKVAGPQNLHVRTYTPDGEGTVSRMREVAGLEPLGVDATPTKVNARSCWAGVGLHRMANAAKMPQRVKRWSVVPIDRGLRKMTASSALMRRADSYLSPARHADLARLRADFPLPSWPLKAAANDPVDDTTPAQDPCNPTSAKGAA